MIYNNLQNISSVSVDCRIILITISTKEVTTLALESALRYTNLPVLIIDKGSNDGSWEHFSKYALSNSRVDLCRADFEKHGETLNKIFKYSNDKIIILLDSDFEIFEDKIVKEMLRQFDNPSIFGSGAIHGPEWLSRQHGFPERTGYYCPRMWTPLTALRVESIKLALDNHISFLNFWKPNELVRFPGISKILFYRFWLPYLREIRLDFLTSFRGIIDGVRPNFLCLDTGADIFRYLSNNKNMKFYDLGMPRMDIGGKHYHGVTRAKVEKNTMTGGELDYVYTDVEKRLKNEYGISFE